MQKFENFDTKIEVYPGTIEEKECVVITLKIYAKYDVDALLVASQIYRTLEQTDNFIKGGKTICEPSKS